MIIEENWLPVDGCKGYYVSDLGRVYSSLSNQFMRPYLHKGRKNKKGRASLYFRHVLGKKKFLTHRLVIEHFRPAANSHKYQVEHLDNNTLNPALSNLIYVNQTLNQKLRHLKNKPNKNLEELISEAENANKTA